MVTSRNTRLRCKTRLEKIIGPSQAWPGAYFKHHTLTLPSSQPLCDTPSSITAPLPNTSNLPAYPTFSEFHQKSFHFLIMASYISTWPSLPARLLISNYPKVSTQLPIHLFCPPRYYQLVLFSYPYLATPEFLPPIARILFHKFPKCPSNFTISFYPSISLTCCPPCLLDVLTKECYPFSRLTYYLSDHLSGFLYPIILNRDTVSDISFLLFLSQAPSASLVLAY